jgi:DNA polymerase elongation subunit (family B)
VRSVVFDIETVGLPWLDLDPMLREALTRGAKSGEEYRAKREWRSLSPYASKVIVIAMLNPETRKGKVWYEAAGAREESDSADGLFRRIGTGEAQMLEEFWGDLVRYDRVVTFNGRSFDGPFLSVRSAVHGVTPSRNLSGYRYSFSDHLDLIEVLTFRGTVGPALKPSLHAACTAFGIPSPKSEEMHGNAVGEAYREGRLQEILDYCRRDVEATAELYRRLDGTLLPLFAK